MGGSRCSSRRRSENGIEAHDDIDMGPIDLVVIAFPAGAPMTGDAMPLLVDLVDRGVIRVLDALFVSKDADGNASSFEAKDLAERGVGDFGILDGASSGLLTDADGAKAAEALDPDSVGVMLVYENRWAGPFVSAVRRNGGLLVASQRVPVEDVLERLDAAEAA
jgi:hypothetical protein